MLRPKIGLDWDDVTAPFNSIAIAMANEKYHIDPPLRLEEIEPENRLRLAQRQLKFIQGLQAALVRIENKTYGICRETGKLIPAERLRAVPHATLSIEAKNNGKK